MNDSQLDLAHTAAIHPVKIVKLGCHTMCCTLRHQGRIFAILGATFALENPYLEGLPGPMMAKRKSMKKVTQFTVRFQK